MKKPAILALTAAAVVLPVGFLAANLGPAAPEATSQAPSASSPATELLPSPKAADVVEAGEAFLATLTAEQRAIAQVELSPRMAVRWTNFPGGSNVRNGVFYRDLKPEQVEAALKVARIALGEEGFSRYQEVRAADDVFAKGRGGRGPGGPGGGPGGPGGGPGGPGGGPGGPVGPGGGPGGPGGMFEQSDANRDGKLSRDEAPGFLRDQFAEIDTDKDGFISPEEDATFFRQRGPRGPGWSCAKEGRRGRAKEGRRPWGHEGASSGRRIT